MPHRVALALAFLACACALPLDAHGQDRVALVIGNGRYVHAPALSNPVNDAQAVTGALRRIGFVVVSGADLDRSGMERTLFEFLDQARAARVVLLFYAGHGLQVEGRNYLVPIDARLDSARDLNFGMIELDKVLASLDEPNRANIVILDACRDNPLARSFATKVRSGAVGAGLAAYTSLGTGTLIAFATAPDKVALDGMGPNSPFTESFVKHVGTPGLEVRQMLTKVRADVARATGDRQVPWDNSSLRGDVYLAGLSPAPELPRAQPQQSSEAERIWALTRDTTSTALLETFIARFPGTIFADLARARLDEIKRSLSVVPTIPQPPPGTSAPATQAVETPPGPVAALPPRPPPDLAPVQVPRANYPMRTVTLIVPFAPGGAVDVIARTVAPKLTELLGQPVIVENRPGAGGGVGARSVASAAADGHTLLVANSVLLSVLPGLMSKPPFNPHRDFSAAGLIAASPQVLVVPASSAARSVADLIAQAKSRPGSVTYASSGVGTLSHLAGAQFAAVSRASLVHAPYAGTGPALAGVSGGQAQMMFADAVTVLTQIKTGQLRALAVAGDRRQSGLPSIPTMTEAGLGGFEAVTRYGLVAPKKTSAQVIAKLNASLRNAIIDRDIGGRLSNMGLEVTPGPAGEHARAIAQETARWSKVIRDAGIKPN